MTLTPVEVRAGVYLKRDDQFRVAGVSGGKARTCWALSWGARHGLVTACGRGSPQANIVACIAKELGLPARIHIPTGQLEAETQLAQANGAELVQHRPGYNSVLIARCREDSRLTGWREIPFGMECYEAIRQTAAQVQNVVELRRPRVVVPVGSGMSLLGVLTGFAAHDYYPQVLGVVVGADPTPRLNRWTVPGLQRNLVLVTADSGYSTPANATLGALRLDPYYEAKCRPYLRPGDLFWIIGCREAVRDKEEYAAEVAKEASSSWQE